jgi:hypothetical protein
VPLPAVPLLCPEGRSTSRDHSSSLEVPHFSLATKKKKKKKKKKSVFIRAGKLEELPAVSPALCAESTAQEFCVFNCVTSEI